MADCGLLRQAAIGQERTVEKFHQSGHLGGLGAC